MQPEPSGNEPGDEAGHDAGPAVNEQNHTETGAAASRRTVTVTGTGLAEATPDLMVVSIGVECRAGSVESAFTRAGTGSAAVAASLRRHGVSDADIRTAGINVRADLAWREGEGQQVTGYVAAGTLTVRLRDLDAAAGAISDAVDAGGDDSRLNGLELAFTDGTAVRAQAREAAWQDALDTARHYARLASARLGRVLSMADTIPSRGPVPLAGLQRVAAAESVTVEAGKSEVSAAITAVWELLDDL